MPASTKKLPWLSYKPGAHDNTLGMDIELIVVNGRLLGPIGSDCWQIDKRPEDSSLSVENTLEVKVRLFVLVSKRSKVI